MPGTIQDFDWLDSSIIWTEFRDNPFHFNICLKNYFIHEGQLLTKSNKFRIV